MKNKGAPQPAVIQKPVVIAKPDPKPQQTQGGKQEVKPGSSNSKSEVKPGASNGKSGASNGKSETKPG
jgi:hypothetical protein